MRSISAWVAGLALALMVAGIAILPLTSPAFTRTLSARYSLAEEAGLPPERMLEVAEQVRAFVVESDADTLPVTVDGRDGFDASASSHLIDVRVVISRARLFTGVLTLLVTAWIVVMFRRKRIDAIAPALQAGAIVTLALIVLAAIAAVSDFDIFFAAFHGLFFATGTWTFAYDSLLIQTFPEPFWITSGAAWAVVMGLGAGLLAWLARLLKTSENSEPEPHSDSSQIGKA